MTESEETLQKQGRRAVPASQLQRPARRRKRILWTAGFLLVASAASAWIGVKYYRGGAARPYSPGEADEAISSDLAQPYERRASASESIDIPRAAIDDGLRKIPQNLPAGAPAPRFADVTAKAGLGSFRAFEGVRTSQLPEDMGSGAAWGDYDNDGCEDLFLVSAGGPLNASPADLAPSMLFRNMGDGTFRRAADFPELRVRGMAAAWGDCDHDGWLDLVVTGYNTLILFRNDHGRLVRDNRFPDPKGFWAGAAWGDYDNDGDLDLYICGYVKYTADPGAARKLTFQSGLEVPYTLNPSSFAPERNLLFRNNGDGTFAEVAAQLGVANTEGRSLNALWHDFDDDGWIDLYVANDISENKLYLNRRGTFVDSGNQAWIAEYRGSMGLAAGDWDGDGDDDLFISHWIAEEFALYNSLIAEQRASNAKTTQKGSSTLHFMDLAERVGIGQLSLQYIGWGAEFADFDNDGWLDLAVANGSTFQKQDDPRRLKPMDSFLFWNNGGKSFFNISPWNRSLSELHVSRGLAVADYDNDGAEDLLIVDRDGGVRLLHNLMSGGNWIELRIRNRAGRQRRPIGFGDGTAVVAYAGGRTLRRTVSSASYLSQSSRRIHFGLGKETRIDKLELHWPGGSIETFTDLKANAAHEIVQGERLAHRMAMKQSTGIAVPDAPVPAPVGPLSRGQMLDFWNKQRGAMDAMKKLGDLPRAAALFRQALALNPEHEDSRYYLANCLAAQGDGSGALEQLDLLIKLNPHSHRAFQRRGLLLAASALSRSDLRAAEAALDQARSINPEETGTMMLLGEVALAMGDPARAEQRLQWVCASNPKAVGAYFLRGYIAYKNGDRNKAREMLARAGSARGKDWKPGGSVLEGDVRRKMHAEASFLSPYWELWSGAPEPGNVFESLAAFLAALR